MRSFCVCVAIIVIIGSAALFNSGEVERRARRMDDLLDEVYESEGAAAPKLTAEWKMARIVFGATVDGELVRDLSEAIADVAACSGGSRGELQRACAVCRVRLYEVAGAERVTLWQIL